MTKNRSFVFQKLPRYGLGNKLILWAKALIFSKENNLDLCITGWVHFSIGPIIRREQSFRIYLSNFKNDYSRVLWKQIITLFIPKYKYQFTDKFKSNNYCCIKLDNNAYITHLYDLKNHREIIRSEFYKMLKQGILDELKKYQKPMIGVHIRRGDFKIASTLTPISYFVELVKKIREIHGSCLPATIFSDGSDEELLEILQLPEVKRTEKKRDITDLLLLSESKIIITSIGSSYSYWAGFISDAIVLHHPDSWLLKTRPESVNNIFFEGSLTQDSEIILTQNLKCIP